jgi:hypothetical protein
MKRLIAYFCICTALLLFTAGQSAAFTHYSQNEFRTAESLDPGMTQAGIFFTLSDKYKTYYPDIRYGLGAMMEVGVRFGATSADINNEDKLGGYLGVDFKYQLVKETEGIPLDLSIDLSFDNTFISNQNASELTFASIVSKSFPLTDRGYKFTPYGGLALSSLYGNLPEDRDIYVTAFAGFEWRISQKFMILLEVKAGEDTIGGMGIRFEY